MRLIDRLIFFGIMLAMGILAARAIVGYPVEAARQEIIKVEIVGVRSWLNIPVELIKIGGVRCTLSDFVKK